jgi:predicted amidohydrolase
MSPIKAVGISYSLSERFSSLDLWEAALLRQIRDLIAQGADLIVYPELFLLAMYDYLPGPLTAQMQAGFTYASQRLLPRLAEVIKQRDVLLCLGSMPRYEDSQIFNTSSIWLKNAWHQQDKIHLTPWEVSTFSPGERLRLFTWRGLRVAVLICFDIEQPSLALKLKEQGVHLVLVPSATMDRNGNQRVNRCASARSVELGAAVLTVPLIGTSACELVDQNEGRQGLFLPAQDLVRSEPENFSEYSQNQTVIAHWSIHASILQGLKTATSETKPYHCRDRDGVIITEL